LDEKELIKEKSIPRQKNPPHKRIYTIKNLVEKLVILISHCLINQKLVFPFFKILHFASIMIHSIQFAAGGFAGMLLLKKWIGCLIILW
jgi:hypothetical protein